MYNTSLDFKKAFDIIKYDMIWAFLEFYVAHEKPIIIFKSIYENAKVAIRVGTDLG